MDFEIFAFWISPFSGVEASSHPRCQGPMSKRGRRAGYTNYSGQEQMLLCHVVDTVKPTGRNMWEQAARLYNSQRSGSWAERDYDSLRRKFKNLYTKPKPSGINGRLPAKHKPVLWAHELQHVIEEKGGANEFHDGEDEGQDDAQLLEEVQAVTDIQSGATRSNEDDERGDSDGGEYVGAGDQNDATEAVNQAGDVLISSSLATSHPDQPVTGNLGTIFTENGPLDVRFGDCLPSDDDDEEDGEGGDCREDGDASVEDSETSQNQEHPVPYGESPTTIHLTETPPAKTFRPLGRASTPRQASKATSATIATTEGPRFSRNPEREEADAVEEELNPRKSPSSNRLGGVDLRILRDNFAEMGGVYKNIRKTSTSGSGSTPTYTASKRNTAKKNMQSLVQDLTAVSNIQAKGDGDISSLLVFFRQEADRRADAEEKRRQEDRKDREAADRRYRDDRDRDRREEALAAEARRQQERKEDRERREEEAKREAGARAERDRERADERRREEDRMRLEREEARQRHEQLMLMLQSLAKTK